MHIVTAAHDRSIRLWERTEEPLILDEEKEQVIDIIRYVFHTDFVLFLSLGT